MFLIYVKYVDFDSHQKKMMILINTKNAKIIIFLFLMATIIIRKAYF